MNIRSFLLPGLLYILGAIVLFPWYRYVTGSADLFQYLEIARFYSEGQWQSAVNPYWSPMISWLMTPFFSAGVDGLIAWKILQVMIGLGVLWLACEMVPADHRLNSFYRIALTFLVFSFAIESASPDLLMLGFYLLLLRLFNRNAHPFWLGLIGAMLYFTKSFGFYFFLLTLPALYFFRGKIHPDSNRSWLQPTALSLFGFMITAAPWIAIMSHHEGKFTISTSGRYNLTLMSPENHPDVLGNIEHPIQQVNYLQLPETSAFSVWSRPDLSFQNPWSPISSGNDLWHLFKTFSAHLLSLAFFHFIIDPGLILLFLILYLLLKNKNGLTQFLRSNYPALIMVISITGLYALILLMHRYVWINDIMILIWIPGLLVLTGWNLRMKSILTAITLFLVILSFSTSFLSNSNTVKDIEPFCKVMEEEGISGRTVVSLPTRFPEQNYEQSSYLAWVTGNRYAGMADANYLLHSGSKLTDPVILDWYGTSSMHIAGKRYKVKGTHLVLIDTKYVR